MKQAVTHCLLMFVVMGLRHVYFFPRHLAGLPCAACPVHMGTTNDPSHFVGSLLFRISGPNFTLNQDDFFLQSLANVSKTRGIGLG